MPLYCCVPRSQDGALEYVGTWADVRGKLEAGELPDLGALVAQAHSHRVPEQGEQPTPPPHPRRGTEAGQKRDEQLDKVKGEAGSSSDAKTLTPSDMSSRKKYAHEPIALVGTKLPKAPPAADLDDGFVRLDDAAERAQSLLDQLAGRTVTPALVASMLDSFRGIVRDGANEKHDGAITARVVGFYFRYWGTPALRRLVLLSSALSALFGVFETVFLAHWTDSNEACSRLNVSSPSVSGTGAATDAAADDVCNAVQQRASLAIFMLFGCLTTAFHVVEFIIARIKCGPRASQAIHNLVLRRVLGARVSFFDNTAQGQILNRLLGDVRNLDWEVALGVAELITKVLDVVVALIVIVLFAPGVLVLLPLLLPAYLHVFNASAVAFRDTRRHSQASQSPLYSHFTDCVLGRETVAAFGAEERVTLRNLVLLRSNTRSRLAVMGCIQWANNRYVQLGTVLYTAAALVAVGMNRTGLLGGMSVAQCALVLQKSDALVRGVMELMMTIASMSSKFVAVERLFDYSLIPPEEVEAESAGKGKAEAARNDGQIEADDVAGALELSNVFFRYQLHQPRVLRGLSLRIGPFDKIALCGRTGCGKSSTFASLLRLYPLEQGVVTLDGVGATAMPLSELRRAVRLVSQDAVLLEGSLLANLYTFDAEVEEQEEEEAQQRAVAAKRRAKAKNGVKRAAPHVVAPESARAEAREALAWRELEAVGMKEKIERLPCGLHTLVSESMFSEGERQLVSLARALLSCGGRSTLRVLLCDEPTSNVDLELDVLVHRALFDLQTTVLMICHRLQHVGGFTRVVTLDHGVVVEDGPPAELLAQPSSRLAVMCAKHGLDTAAVQAAGAAVKRGDFSKVSPANF